METAPGTSTNNIYCIRDLIRMLYMQEVIKLIYCAEVSDNLKLNIVPQSHTIINLYFVFYNAVIDCMKQSMIRK